MILKIILILLVIMLIVSVTSFIVSNRRDKKRWEEWLKDQKHFEDTE